MLRASANFHNQFSNTIVKDCDIHIYSYVIVNTVLTEILDGSDISSFSISRKNSGICEKMPTDTCTFDVLKWSQVLPSTRTFLTKPKNYVVIQYTVGGYNTETGNILQIEKCLVDEQFDKATITLRDVYSLNTSMTLEALGTYVNFKDLIPPPNIAVWAQQSKTLAELIQNYSIGLGKGVRLAPLDFQNYIQVPQHSEYVNLTDVTADISFDYRNIKRYMKYDVEDRSTITAYGLTPTGSETNLKSITVTVHGTSDRVSGTWLLVGTGNVVVTSFSVTRVWNGSTTDVTSQFNMIYYGFAYQVEQKNTSAFLGYGTYTIIFTGYSGATFNEPTNNDYSIKCYTQLSGSQGLATVQTNARDFYSKTTCFEFDCRIDPCIEPLDKLLIEDMGVFLVEEVNINFNGGYNGKIKARYLGEEATYLDPVTTVTGWIPESFSFEIRNNNAFRVEVLIYYSLGFLSFFIDPHSTLYCNNQNCPQLESSFQAYENRDLMDSITCRFDASGYGYSNSVMIVEANWE